MENIFLIISGISLILVVYGYIDYNIKSKKGKPLYKISESHCIPLNQITITTDPSFGLIKHKQDEIFESNFFVGKKISTAEKMQTISRIKKQEQLKTINTGFSYIVYFEKYENCEFPKDIFLKNHFT